MVKDWLSGRRLVNVLHRTARQRYGGFVVCTASYSPTEVRVGSFGAVHGQTVGWWTDDGSIVYAARALELGEY